MSAMKYDVLQEAVVKNEERKKRRAWHRVVTCMAAVVVFCTTYALILPAITLTPKKTCGMKEHEHSSWCYKQIGEQSQLTCEKKVHNHDDILCYIDDTADVETTEVWEEYTFIRLVVTRYK